MNKAIATHALLLAAIAALAGCSGSQPFIASGDAKSVQVNYSGDAASALPLARHHCAQYERNARLDYSGDGIAVFDCVMR